MSKSPKSKSPNSKKPDRPPVPPPTARALSEAMRSSSLMDISDWQSVVAVTLNFKEHLRNDGGSFTKLTEDISRDELVAFGNRLDRAIYGNASTRYGKRVRRIVYLEKGQVRGWHAHLTLERPERTEDVKFHQIVRDCWNRSSWSVDGKIEFDADSGWTRYSAKVRSKDELVSWTDSLVTEACVFATK